MPKITRKLKPDAASIGLALATSLAKNAPANTNGAARSPAARSAGPQRRADRRGRVAIEAFLPETMHKALRLHAAETRRTLQAQIEEAIGDYLVKTGAQRHVRQ